MTRIAQRALAIGRSLLIPVRTLARRLPAPLLRLLKRAAANQRDREIISALAPLNAGATWETPRCAICGGASVRLHLLKNGFSIVRCRTDGLLFVSPRPAELKGYYDSRYYHGGVPGVYESYEVHAARMEDEWSERLSILDGAGDGSRRLLDVGAATGNFLALARRKGWQVRGIDLSDWAAAEARRVHLVDVVSGTLPHAAFEPGTFDAITMWDCIEHLSDPLSVINAVRILLAPKGVLALSTGEVPDRDPRALSGWYYPPWHLYYFSRESIGALLQKAGFEIIEYLQQDPDSPYAVMTVIARPHIRPAH